METSKNVSAYDHYSFAWNEFLDKPGLPRDTDVLQVRLNFEGPLSFTVIAKAKETA